MSDIRHNWTAEEISEIFERPLLSLVVDAAIVHRQYHKSGEVQISSLLSIKTRLTTGWYYQLTHHTGNCIIPTASAKS